MSSHDALQPRLHSADRTDERDLHVCYRSVGTDPPTERDFMSYWDMGRRPRPHTTRRERQYRGVSVFDTEEHARANALRHGLGPLLARLEIPASAPIEVTPIGNLLTGHHDLYGTPSDMLACVVPPVIAIATR